jgi:hypothetical protein
MTGYEGIQVRFICVGRGIVSVTLKIMCRYGLRIHLRMKLFQKYQRRNELDVQVASWFVVLFSHVCGYDCFRGLHCLHLQGRSE